MSSMQIYMALEQALRAGDTDAARAALGDPAGYPNVRDPYTNQPLLQLAIAWAPPDAVRALLADGADPNFEALDGFPALVGAILSRRDDRHAVVELLIRAGADLEARGINDWTPLEAAASIDDGQSSRLLRRAGAG